MLTVEIYHDICRKIETMSSLKEYHKAYHYLREEREKYDIRLPELDYYAGILAWRSGQDDLAEQEFMQAMERDSHNYWLIAQVSDFYLVRGKYKKAQKILECAYMQFCFSYLSEEEIDNIDEDDGFCDLMERLASLAEKRHLLKKVKYQKYYDMIQKKYSGLTKINRYSLLG